MMGTLIEQGVQGTAARREAAPNFNGHEQELTRLHL
jgi:hypothetical protein